MTVVTAAMTALDWQPLAEIDPVPGDPVAVLELAGSYGRVAQDVGAQVRAVRRIERAGGWEGRAADAFTARVGHLPDDLDAVGERFQRVAQALREFAPALESARRRARQALAVAHAAQAAEAVQATRVDEAARAAKAARAERTGVESTDGPTCPAPVPVVPHLLPTAGDSMAGPELDLARARRLLAGAVEERDRAAARCARALDAAGRDRLRNPGVWHRLLGGVSSWAGQMSTWLGVAAVILCWVPGLGEALGGLSLGLGAIGLLADLALTSYGDQSWTADAADAIGVVPFGKAAKLGAFMSREAAVANAVERVATARPLRAVHGKGLLKVSTPQRFERTRGLHGLASLTPVRPISETQEATRQFAQSVQVGVGLRSLADFLRSPGGLLDDIARARLQQRGGTLWLAGSHGADSAQAGAGVLTSPPSGGAP
jgi:uncharacterized protein YukE